jgi:signal transduction histidine kinase
MTLTAIEELRFQSALAASVVHEVNQPLTGMVINAGTCLRKLTSESPDIEGARETARRMLRDGQRAAQIIIRLRALFAQKSARTELVDLNDAAREVIALSTDDLQRRHVSVRMEMESSLPRVAGDRIQLQQVISNLLLNACEAMADVEPSSRQLVIATECDGVDRVKLSIRDAGSGLDAQIRDRLFQPFCTTKCGGMGIGLFVSRSIIEGHQGCLEAAQNEGPGATFSFSLPAPPSTPKAEPPIWNRLGGVQGNRVAGVAPRL